MNNKMKMVLVSMVFVLGLIVMVGCDSLTSTATTTTAADTTTTTTTTSTTVTTQGGTTTTTTTTSTTVTTQGGATTTTTTTSTTVTTQGGATTTTTTTSTTVTTQGGVTTTTTTTSSTTTTSTPTTTTTTITTTTSTTTTTLGATLLYQKNGTGTAALGTSVSDAGDVNDDGYGDFIVGGSSAYQSAGKALVYSGSDGSLLYEISGEAAGDSFGASVSGAGDVDGDGNDDFIIGASEADPLLVTNAGKAYVYSGVDGSLLYEMSGEAQGNSFGCSVSGAGDLDEDGQAEFIVGASQASKAYVYSGVDGTLLFEISGEASTQFGISVSGAGDINGDEKADIIIGATDAGSGFGKAYVYSSDETLIYEVTGEADADQFGKSVSDAGDVNFDGTPDFIVGAPQAGPGDPLGPGKAYVYSGLDGSLLYEKTGEEAEDSFGTSVSGAGFVNDDTNADFIVGAWMAGPGIIGTGKAYVFSGATGNLMCEITGEAEMGGFGTTVSGAGDVDNDGDSDIIVGAPSANMSGRAYVYAVE